MALKFFPRESTSLFSFLREYNLSLSFCTHPSLTRALGIAYSTPSHYVFAQQASLFGDLYDVIIPEVRGLSSSAPLKALFHQHLLSSTRFRLFSITTEYHLIMGGVVIAWWPLTSFNVICVQHKRNTAMEDMEVMVYLLLGLPSSVRINVRRHC